MARTPYQEAFEKKNCIQKKFQFNLNTDADIVEFLKQQENQLKLIKELIREEIKKQGGIKVENKYFIKKTEIQIPSREMEKAKRRYASETGRDVERIKFSFFDPYDLNLEYELVKRFDDLESAKKAIKDYPDEAIESGGTHFITEHFISEVEWNENDETWYDVGNFDW